MLGERFGARDDVFSYMFLLNERVLGGSSQLVSGYIITRVSFRPLSRVVPLTNGRTSWLINGGDPNHLLTRMILQVNIP